MEIQTKKIAAAVALLGMGLVTWRTASRASAKQAAAPAVPAASVERAVLY